MSIQVLVLYYSRHGSTLNLARHIARGIESVVGCEAILRTVPDWEQSEPSDYPYATLQELESADALAFGSPCWFGNMPGAMKHFWDSTTTLWVKGALIDKPACVFTSSSSLHGGQESTLQSMHLPLLHHGMILVGIPYSEPLLHKTQTGGSPYGASHLADNSSKLSSDEQELAKKLGQRLASIAKKLKA
ncbi:NAD(P)H:quinone oxidoreductase [Vibrio sp.]|nr:NAD(P)H:quinone oxidoreductase [Vibrio sp.]